MTKLLTNRTERFKPTLYDYKPLRERELGDGALFEFIGHVSASRCNLFLSESQQKIVINDPDRPPNVTKFLTSLPKSSLAIRQDDTAKVVTSITLVGGTEKFILYRYDDGKLGHVIIPSHFSLHQRLGFKLKPVRQDFRPGSTITKGEILADTPSNLGGIYSYGVLLNVCLGSFPDVSEDGYVISEDVVDKVKYVTDETITFSVKPNDVLLPIFGGGDVKRTLPVVGEKLRSDNIVAVVRALDSDISVAQLTAKNITKIRSTDSTYTFKDAFEGTVTKVEVIRGTKERLVTGNNHLDNVALNYINYYKDIWDAYFKACGGARSLYGGNTPGVNNTEFRNVTPELATYLTRILGILELNKKVSNSGNASKIRVKTLTLNKEEFGSYLISITISKLRSPDMASKLADRAGSKGVLSSRIWKVEDMPIDENGIRAQVLGSGVATLNRNNVGRLKEQYFNLVSRKTADIIADILDINTGNAKPRSPRKLIKVTRNAVADIYYDDKRRFDLAIDALVSSLEYYDPDTAEFISQSRDEEPIIDYITDILVLGRVTTSYSATSMAGKTMERIISIENNGEYIYKPTPVTYRNPAGKVITTKEPIRIAPTYMMFLERDSSEFSGTDTCYLQSQNFTASTTRADKQKKSISSTNVSNLGLDEASIVSSSVTPTIMAEFKDSLSNPVTIAHIADLILQSDDCVNIQGVNRSVIPFGGTTAQRVTSHIMMTWGISMKYKPYDWTIDR